MPIFANSEPREPSAALLAEALDQLDLGVLRLDADLRVQFVNRRFKELWEVPDDVIHGRAHLRAMMDCVQGARWQHRPDADREAYLREREAQITAGAVPPYRIDLPDGRCLWSRCDVCADGGRIVTCLDVTGLVHEAAREAEERASADVQYNAMTLEEQAAHLAELAEAAEEHAQRAETARILLSQEIAERRELECRLRVLATTDGLTGALNRAAFIAEGQQAVGRACRSGEDLAVFMLDVDHFKSVNDQFGHAGGDLALRHLVDVMRGLIRGNDLLGRLGGEEFAVVLPGVSADAAERVAERLRCQIAETPAVHGGRRIALTVSIGVAMCGSADDDIEPVLARADDALYRAKQTGRNCVVTGGRTAAAA